MTQKKLINCTFSFTMFSVSHKNCSHFSLPFATCAGIGDGHWRAALLVLLAFEFRELDVADSGRSKDEQRCNKCTKNVIKNCCLMFIVSTLCSFHFMQLKVNERLFFRKSANWREKCAIKWSQTSVDKLTERKRNLQLAMEVYMRATWLVTFAMCFRWWSRQDFEMCRQSVLGVDVLARKQLKLYVDGRHLRRLLELQAVATLKQHVTDLSLSRPRKMLSLRDETDGEGRRKTWFMSSKKVK